MKSKRMSVVAAAATQHGDLNLDTIWTCWEEHEIIIFHYLQQFLSEERHWWSGGRAGGRMIRGGDRGRVIKRISICDFFFYLVFRLRRYETKP